MQKDSIANKSLGELTGIYFVPGLIFLVTFIGVFPLDVYLPSIPEMAINFHVTISQMSQTISLFTLIFAIMQIINGALSDVYGRKIVLLVGLGVALIATIALLVVHNYRLLILLRVLQATGLSCFVVTQAIIRDVYSNQAAIKLQIFLTVLSGLLIAISPLLGGWLQILFGWKGSFYICAVVIFITFILVKLFFIETNLSAGKSKFKPILQLIEYCEIYSHPKFRKYAVIAMLAFSSHFAFIVSSAYLLNEILNISVFNYSLLMLLYGMFYLLSGMMAMTLIKNFSEKIILIGSFFMLSGGILMLYFSMFDLNVSAILVPMMFVIIGVTLVRPMAINKALEFNREKSGKVSAMLSLIQFLGAGVLSYLVTFLNRYAQLPLACLIIFSGVVTLSIMIYKRSSVFSS